MSVDTLIRRRLVGLGEEVTARRLQLGLTHLQLAARADVMVEDLVRLEAGEGEGITLGAAAALAAALGVTVSQLISGGEERA
jgi:transcriptional regulator with XRE-family HTH domain